MKFNLLGFSQLRAMELGLDLKDLTILRYIVDFIESGKMIEREIDGKVYYWIKQETLIEALPILNISGSIVLRRRLKKLEELNILEYKLIKKGGTYCFYGVGKELPSLLYEKGANQKVKREETKEFKSANSKVKPKDNSIKDSSDKDIEKYNIKNISKEVINYLNELIGTRYNYRAKSISNLIRKRLEEGYTISDFKEVIKRKHKEWRGTEYEKYLRPSILFRGSKFDEYLNQKEEIIRTVPSEPQYSEFEFD